MTCPNCHNIGHSATFAGCSEFKKFLNKRYVNTNVQINNKPLENNQSKKQTYNNDKRTYSESLDINNGNKMIYEIKDYINNSISKLKEEILEEINKQMAIIDNLKVNTTIDNVHKIINNNTAKIMETIFENNNIFLGQVKKKNNCMTSESIGSLNKIIKKNHKLEMNELGKINDPDTKSKPITHNV